MKLISQQITNIKLQEIQSLIGDHIEIVSLSDMGFNEDIPETGSTIDILMLLKNPFIFIINLVWIVLLIYRAGDRCFEWQAHGCVFCEVCR